MSQETVNGRRGGRWIVLYADARQAHQSHLAAISRRYRDAGHSQFWGRVIGSSADRETAQFMWRFYRHAMTTDLAGAIAAAQRETLRDPAGSPLDWAVFALFGDAAAMPAPRWFGRWWAARRQRRHAESFSAVQPI